MRSGGVSGSGTVTSGVAGTATLNVQTDSYMPGVTFPGVIQDGSGTVALVKAGTGRVFLTGANTFSGAVTVGAGTLVLTGDNRFTAVTTIASGATLQVGAGGTSGTLGSGWVSGAGTLAFNRSDTQAVSNPISGALSVAQQGSGLLILSGAVSYTGSTTIQAGGSVQVGGSNTADPARGIDPLAARVRAMVKGFREPLLEHRHMARMRKHARTAFFAHKLVWARELAEVGVRLKGNELRGVRRLKLHNLP